MFEGAVLGVLLFTVGVICLGLAVLWYDVWPKDKTPEPFKQLPQSRPRPVAVQSILRWFHTLIWMLLAAACFFAFTGRSTLVTACLLLAGVMYVVFIVTLIKDRQRQKAIEREGTGSQPPR
jgi:Flp pilus assembly protein TadB